VQDLGDVSQKKIATRRKTVSVNEVVEVVADPSKAY
jgi:hypothetical protein